LKSLLWPSVQTGTDVDYLGTQGFLIATLVGGFSFVFSAMLGQWIIGTLLLVFFFLGGVGIRERSLYAAIVVFAYYALDTMFSGISIVRIIVAALLLANLRATFIATQWHADSPEAELPPRLGETFSDRFTDRLPLCCGPR
jgi:hypothetical protein